MLKNIAYRLLGLALMAFCAGSWAWMLGALAPYIPTAGIGAGSAQWIDPGILSMPGTIASIAGLIGFLFLIGALPLSPASREQAK